MALAHLSANSPNSRLAPEWLSLPERLPKSEVLLPLLPGEELWGLRLLSKSSQPPPACPGWCLASGCDRDNRFDLGTLRLGAPVAVSCTEALMTAPPGLLSPATHMGAHKSTVSMATAKLGPLDLALVPRAAGMAPQLPGTEQLWLAPGVWAGW